MLVAVLAHALAYAPRARAFEDKIALAAGAGYAVWPGRTAPHGAAFDVQAGLGLSEAWQLRAGAAYAVHPSDASGSSMHSAGLRTELVYMVDIVDIVPFGGLGMSAIAVLHPRGDAIEPAAHFVAGAAYWLSFDWLLELDVRAHFVPGEVEREPLYLVSTLSLVLTLDR